MVTKIPAIQSQSSAAAQLFERISEIVDRNTTEEPEPVEQGEHGYATDYDNCKWGFIFMNTSYTESTFDYATTCCFDSFITGNETLIKLCYEESFAVGACRIVPSQDHNTTQDTALKFTSLLYKNL